MPYESRSDLPDSVTSALPKHAQEIFLAAYNNAYEEYAKPEDRDGDDTREEVAFKVAWSAVKQRYHKSDSGNWVKDDD
ncbi:ChaB family protein [Alteromonas sp. H39]|uniref:ChaB family protein n=1 Tax=Alteromonas sp. H39 TaxID=3389876 RepID=UPI0039DF31D5